MAIPEFNFGQKGTWPFIKALQWIRSGYGQWNSGAVKPPVDYSFDNNVPLYQDKADGTTALPVAILADTNNITQLSNPHGVNAQALALQQLATPSAPTATAKGTAGSTTYTYEVVAKSGQGETLGTSPASSSGSTTTGNATLSTANYVQLKITAVANAKSYDVYRTVGGATQGRIGTVSTMLNAQGLVQNAVIGSGSPVPVTLAGNGTASAVGTLLFNDTGLAGDGTTAPTTNTSGIMQAPVCGDISVVQLSTPANVTATVQGTAGSTTISYEVVARSQSGTTAASSAATVTTANATLTTANNVLVQWNAVPGALSYDVYRTAAGGTPSTTGKIGNVLAQSEGTVLSFTDTGLAGDSSSAPSTNSTGKISGSLSGVGGANFIATENGANNAIASPAGSGPALATGLVVNVQLAHTLAGSTSLTFAYNGGSALAIKSHFNTANNVATAYAATGIISLIYNGSIWLDLSQ